ncbi:hypothetical protein KIH74_27995 [Kineosporia sp. J2-2]|uniref:Uncharacterized protein n=1 Tax=Kineosporia corallincola TaxID=2835133 RepID=A0ABS5TNZ2_9ACTN|nr:hypothetical protein [Kineosporia corallincola]MBT0772816.1 hypothetical protein [Kineosporia corallincola]
MVNAPLHRVPGEGFSAVFMLGADDDPATVDNIDAELVLPTGARWSATFMTPTAIRRVLDSWAETGENSGGSWFQCPDLVIVPEGGLDAMTDAFRGILRAGGPEGVLGSLEE